MYKKYGIELGKVFKIDLRKVYFQCRPNDMLNHLYLNEDTHISNSPHVEIFEEYYKRGRKWLKKNYKDLRYYKFMRHLGKGEKFPKRIVNVGDSIKNGYLRNKYKDDYIVVLKETFASTRYNRSQYNLVPEIWSGHHRAAALFALERFIVDVRVGIDVDSGSCFCDERIHELCKGED